MSRAARIVQVTLGLMALGVVVGGIIGAVLVMILSAGSWDGGNNMAAYFGEAALAGGEFGAVMGAVLAPVAAWTLMRHVPLWRAVSETAVGTIVGSTIGFMLQPIREGLLSPVYLGVAGFALAGLRLRFARRGRRQTSPVDASAGE